MLKSNPSLDCDIESQTNLSLSSSKFILFGGSGSGYDILLTDNWISLFLNSPVTMYVHPGIKNRS